MAKGGARTRSGPPPDPNALARDRDVGEWKVLPRRGRRGKPPPWPLPDDVRGRIQIEFLERRAAEARDQWANAEGSQEAVTLARRLETVELDLAETRAILEQQERMELELWAQLWALPQAVMWERQRQHWEVALYARRMIEAQERGSAVSRSTLVRQMADSLGLTVPGLRANRWKIEDADAGAKPAPASPARRSARDRLKVVPGGGD